MSDKDITIFAIQKILDFQMPTGEWGYYDVNFRNRYERVKRSDYISDARLRLFRKPNVYRTLTALEVLGHYCKNKFNARTQKGVAWIKRNLSSGWFIEWDEFSSGPFPDRNDLFHIEKAPDIRHTAQALLTLLKFDRTPGPELSKGLYNILNSQFETGMWPRKPGFNGTEIFRSVCCADLLWHALDYKNKEKLTRLGIKEDFFQKARLALDRTCAWLVTCAEKSGGLWEDEYQTAMVLERLGRRLLTDSRYASSVNRAVTVLLDQINNGGWTNSSIRDHKIRFSDTSRYETTIRIQASLQIIQGGNYWLPEKKMQPVLDYLKNSFEPDKIDASDYRYFLHIFCPDNNEFATTIQKATFYDYLSAKKPLSPYNYRSINSLLDMMGIWVTDCLGRLGNLIEGKALGLSNYDQAFLEKEEELLMILNSMKVNSVDHPMQHLPASLLEYFQTGDLQLLWDQLGEFCKQYQLPVKTEPPIGSKIYREVRSVVIELGAKYLELITKP